MSIINDVFCIFFMLQLKHFILDFVLQPPYEYLNKGTYGHPGGVRHAVKHGVGTFVVMFFFISELDPAYFLILGILDGIVHYHIDWAKMKLNKIKGWSPKDYEFWVLMGLDQYAHQLTYILIVMIMFTWIFR